MSRLSMTVSLLLCSVLKKSSLDASLAFWRRKEPTPKENALIDPKSEQRAQALEVLKQHPHIISYLKEKGIGALQQSASTGSGGITSLGTQPVNVRAFLQALKQEQERAPERPIFVAVNINSQSVYSENDPVGKIGVPAQEASSHTTITDVGIRTLQWAGNNKMSCLGYCFMGCYAGVQLYLLSLRRYLSKEDSWSRWKNHLTLEELYRITTHNLIQDIIKSKVQAFQQWSRPAVGVVLKQCSEEIGEELSKLSSSKSFMSFIQVLPFQWLLLYKSNLVEEVSLRIQRLVYLKSAILSFLEERKSLEEAPPA